MEANTREEVVNKSRSFEKMKSEAEKCLAQGEQLCNETYAKLFTFENETYAKTKLRRDKEVSGRTVEEKESTDKTERFDSGRSDNEQSEEEASKKATSSKARGRNRTARS